jgi:hypothetical protein
MCTWATTYLFIYLHKYFIYNVAFKFSEKKIFFYLFLCSVNLAQATEHLDSTWHHNELSLLKGNSQLIQRCKLKITQTTQITRTVHFLRIWEICFLFDVEIYVCGVWMSVNKDFLANNATLERQRIAKDINFHRE